MFICIEDVLTGEDLSSLLRAIDELDFGPGEATAGWRARAVKRNRQAVRSAARTAVRRRIVAALERHPLVRELALPARIAPPLIVRYGPGESYGPHVDDALIGTPPLRGDLSLTLFLGPADAFEGGELVVASAAGEEAVKLDAGAAVLYPSGSLHHVAPVTRGERLVAVTWIQSLVRDAAARDMLFELATALRELHARDPACAALDRIAAVRANLLRRWAEP